MLKHYDVMVVGFGTSGSMAAIAAARQGAAVLVLERSLIPGGTMTGCFVAGYYRQEPIGLMRELRSEAVSLDAEFGGEARCIEASKLVRERELRKCGGEVQYGVCVFEVLKHGRRVVGLRWVNAEGQREESMAHVVIDATADAAIAILAGCNVHSGRSSDGDMNCFTNGVLLFREGHSSLYNFDAGKIDPSDDEDYSNSIMETFQPHIVDDYSVEMNGYAMTSEFIGIRDGLHIDSLHQYSLEKLLEDKDASVPDPIFVVHSNIDTHARDMALESELFQDWMIGNSMWGTDLNIPVSASALLPIGVDGLLCASRHLGVEHDVGYAIRMNPCMGAVGEAAGIWAALAAQRQADIRDVPYSELAARLHVADFLPLEGNGSVFDVPREEWLAALDSDIPGFAVWSARRQKDSAFIRDIYENAIPDSRLRKHCAMALALMGDAGGIEDLRKMAAERDTYAPLTSRKYNHQRGYVAVYLLGKLRDCASIGLLADILMDDSAEPTAEYQSHALTALLKIGDDYPEEREKIARIVRKRLEDPEWTVMTRFKGTDNYGRADAAFRIYGCRRLRDWHCQNHIAEVLLQLPLNAHEQHLVKKFNLQKQGNDK